MYKALLVDNYDSFTYNLWHLCQQAATVHVDIKKNDKFHLEEVAKYDYVIISPGPDIPNAAGLILDLIERYAFSKPILGICLGHQAIGQSFGAGLRQLTSVHHGEQSMVRQSQVVSRIFEGVPESFPAGRYHSWVLDEASFPHESLLITSRDKDGEIMSMEHKELPLFGIQFHPESMMTPHGLRMMENFFTYA